MSFFFIPAASTSTGALLTIEGAAAHRLLHVRRFKTGEVIEVQTEDGKRYNAKITGAAARSITFEILTAIDLPAIASRDVRITIAQISENNLDLVIQKSVELGATHITIFQAEHSPHAIKTDRLAHKMERWEAIAINACEQSGRATPPSIRYLESLKSALLAAATTNCIALEQGAPPFSSTTRESPVTLFVGPEGGWSASELQLLKDNPHVSFLSLGVNTLRAETAAIAALAIVTQ